MVSWAFDSYVVNLLVSHVIHLPLCRPNLWGSKICVFPRESICFVYLSGKEKYTDPTLSVWGE